MKAPGGAKRTKDERDLYGVVRQRTYRRICLPSVALAMYFVDDIPSPRVANPVM